MDAAHAKAILQGIDRQIDELNRKLQELEAARQSFIKEQDGAVLTQSGDQKPRKGGKGHIRRLPKGIPEKWVLEALNKQSRITPIEINDIVEKNHDKRLADGTIRRVLDKLLNDKVLFYREDEGTWEVIRKTVNDDSTDLPF